MPDTALKNFTSAAAWTATSSVVGSDSATPSGSFLWTKAKFDAIYGTGPANPSASAGLAAVNGSATTFMRSDGAPAISQAIVPTWTGQHIFAQGVITTSKPITNSQTWNDGAVTFVGQTIAITKTAAAAASDMFRVTVGGNTKASIGLDTNFAIGIIRAAIITTVAADSTDLRIASAGGDITFLPGENSTTASASLTTQGLLSVGATSTVGGVKLTRTNGDADAPAPASGATLYSKQVVGKNALFVRFPTGAVQQLAIEI